MSYADPGVMLGAAADAVANIGSAYMQAGEHRKQRNFQREMYARQLEDARENWRMQNEYNLPVNQYRRQMEGIEAVGLNPLLLYGQGGVSQVAASSLPQTPSVPNTGAANVRFGTNFGQAMQQSRLLDAQIRLMESEANKNDSQSENTDTDTEQRRIELQFSRDTYELRKAIQYGNMEVINQSLNNMRQEMLNGARLNAEQCMTLAQGRLYQRKEYELNAEQIGNSIRQQWEMVAIGKMNASAAVRNSFAAMMNAQSSARLTNAQIGAIALDMAQKRDLFPALQHEQFLKNQGFRLDNLIKTEEVGVKKLQKFQNALDAYKSYKGMPSGSIFDKYAAPLFAPRWNTMGDFKSIYELGK